MSEKVEIENVIIKDNNTEVPVLLNFQNGNLKVESLEKLEYITAVNQKTTEREAIVTLNKDIFHGVIKNGGSGDEIDTFIAVKSKKSNKVRLIQIQEASLFHSVYDEEDQGLIGQMSENVAKIKRIKEFGGRLAHRGLERAERMKVNMDVVKEQLEKSLQKSNTEDDSLSNEVGNEASGVRPPFNKTAQKLSDVFDLYDVIPKELLERMDKEVVALLTVKAEEIPSSSDYIKKKLKDIKISSDPGSTQNSNSIKCLIYMDALRNLIKLKARNFARVPLSNITEKVETDIRERFAQPEIEKKMITSYTKTKAICYYIVLALLTSPDYQIDINILIQELSIPREKIIRFANFVNAKLKTKSPILSLRLPETIKAPKSGFLKRKR